MLCRLPLPHVGFVFCQSSRRSLDQSISKLCTWSPRSSRAATKSSVGAGRGGCTSHVFRSRLQASVRRIYLKQARGYMPECAPSSHGATEPRTHGVRCPSFEVSGGQIYDIDSSPKFWVSSTPKAGTRLAHRLLHCTLERKARTHARSAAPPLRRTSQVVVGATPSSRRDGQGCHPLGSR